MFSHFPQIRGPHKQERWLALVWTCVGVVFDVSVWWCTEAVATEVNGLSRLIYNLVCSNRTDLSYCNFYPPICVSGIFLFADWMESPVRLHSNYHNHLLQFTHPTFYYLSTTQAVSPVLKYLKYLCLGKPFDHIKHVKSIWNKWPNINNHNCSKWQDDCNKSYFSIHRSECK